MSIPEWTKDEQSIDAAKGYLRQGGCVDFFEMIARRILQEHPLDIPGFCLEIVNDVLNGKEIPVDPEFQPRKVEENQYMRESKVSDFLDEWVLALLRQRPTTDAERMKFHQQYLQSLKGGN